MILAPAIPYVAVTVGMHVFRSGWAAILAYHAGICVALLCSGDAVGRLRKLVPGKCALAAFVLVPLFACAGPIVFVLWPFAGLPGVHLSSSLAVFGLRGSAWIAFLVYYSFVNPWLEELFWRGLLARKTSFGWTSDLLYAGYHLFVLAPFITLPWLLFCFILVKAGTLPEPLIGLNFTKFDNVSRKSWWYRKVFSVPGSWRNSAAIELSLDGLDVHADIWLNGRTMGGITDTERINSRPED
ncbi:MAG: hypothetical protein E4H02_04360 [Lentisphaerales bacterium]|nr:MAG: hypothetical protein E4H02_04360 [Lentisphaerales bacterium]